MKEKIVTENINDWLKVELPFFVANKIKELRNAVGWSQSDLARQSGVTNAAISQIEKGNRIPSLLVTRKIALALSVSVAVLAGETLLSDKEINEKTQTFFRKFGGLNELSESDQEIIKLLISRMGDNKNKVVEKFEI